MRVRRSLDPVVGLIALTILATACSRDPDVQAREYLASADRYAEARQYEAAIIEYRNAIKVRPDLAEAHFKLARVYEATGDPVHAYSAYARSADLEPSNMDAQLKAGALLIAAGEYDMARIPPRTFCSGMHWRD
jgi:Tfp pilus assembly protein PilF